MASKLLSLALIASSAVSALPRSEDDASNKPGFLKFPITREHRTRPLVRRDLDVPLYNVTSISYLIQRKQSPL